MPALPLAPKPKFVSVFTRYLLDPPAQIEIASERRRARVLSGLLLFIATMVAASIPFNSRIDASVSTLAFILTLVGYLSSRSRHYRTASLFTIAGLMLPSFATVLMAPADQVTETFSVAVPLSWLLIGLILASLGSRAWVTAVVTVVTVSMILGLPILRPEIDLVGIFWIVTLLSISGGLLILAAALRNRDLQEIEAQTNTLLEQQQEIQISSERYRNLVENVSDIVYTTDVNGFFTYISPSAIALTGYSAAELVGMHYTDLVEPSWHMMLMEFYKRQLRNNDAETIVAFPIQTQSGETRWVEQKTSLNLKNQRLTGFQSIVRDITERKRAEEQIHTQNEALVKANRELAIARKQAEAANKLKSQFLATMSHELRTPLNAVIGYAQLQLAGMAGEMTEDQLEFQERILVNAQHLLQLINEVLDISKIEAGRLELAERPFDLRACLDEVMLQNKVLAEEKHIEFNMRLDNRLPKDVVGDRGRIKQVIINLVSNAIKFTDAGSVTVNASLYNKESWRIAVSDTGVGISPTMQETIFDEFRQAESGIERGGTGLGLAIVRKLVLMMGGNIRVSSEIGQGSTFTVTLPLVTESQAALEVVEA